MPEAPFLSKEQRLNKLKIAIEYRQKRKEVKKQLRLRQIKFEEFITIYKNDPVIKKMFLIDIIGALPYLDKKFAKIILDTIGLKENKRLNGLGPKQQAKLIDVVNKYNVKDKSFIAEEKSLCHILAGE